jgi:hypothetical protein
MATAADFAEEFVQRARAGEKSKVRVEKMYAAAFLGELIRYGIKLADECLDSISDPELRGIIKSVLMSAAAGALLGTAIGATAGPQGAKVGAAIGATVGVIVGAFAILVRYHQVSGPDGPALVFEAA